jgi:hypothetical protein
MEMLLAKGEYSTGPRAVDRSPAALSGSTCLPSPSPYPRTVIEPVSENAWAIKIGKHGDNDPAMVHPKDRNLSTTTLASGGRYDQSAIRSE